MGIDGWFLGFRFCGRSRSSELRFKGPQECSDVFLGFSYLPRSARFCDVMFHLKDECLHDAVLDFPFEDERAGFPPTDLFRERFEFLERSAEHCGRPEPLDDGTRSALHDES